MSESCILCGLVMVEEVWEGESASGEARAVPEGHGRLSPP